MKIILLDTETTDIGGHLIQIAWRAYADAECVNSGQYLVKPPEPVTFGAMAVHHITNEMLEEKPPVSDGLRSMVQKFLDDHIMVAHNALFDVTVIRKAGMFPKKVICTYKVAYYLFPDEEAHNLQYLRYSLGLNDAELDKINAHDAMGDVLVLEKLFARCLGKMSAEKPIEECLEEMVKMSANPLLLRKATFGKNKGKTWNELYHDDEGRKYMAWLLGSCEKNNEDNDSNLMYTLYWWIKGVKFADEWAVKHLTN